MSISDKLTSSASFQSLLEGEGVVLTPRNIHEHEFSRTGWGHTQYRAEEVDDYLDIIIDQYNKLLLTSANLYAVAKHANSKDLERRVELLEEKIRHLSRN